MTGVVLQQETRPNTVLSEDWITTDFPRSQGFPQVVYRCTMAYDAVPGTVFRGPSHDIGVEGLATSTTLVGLTHRPYGSTTGPGKPGWARVVSLVELAGVLGRVGQVCVVGAAM